MITGNDPSVSMTMHRLDNLESLTIKKTKGLRFNVIAGQEYGASWDDGVPREFSFRGLNLDK